MSKQTKRKITVEVASKTSEQPKSRPSVFERLGTKTTTTSNQTSEYCRHWSQNGTCPYGKSCKYASTHTLTSPSKRAAKKDEQIQKKQNQNQNRTTATGKDDPTNKRLHSTIVKALRSPEPEWEQWNQTDLEDADAEMLEKRRQELQRELEIQMKMESKLTKTKEKTSVKKGSSSSSSNSSSSSTESSSSSEETSSTSSSTSLDSRSRKAKRTKPKRDSSSSTEPERRKKKAGSKTGHKHTSSTSNIKTTEKKKTASPALKTSTTTKSNVKSPSPTRVSHRLSQTPPLKSNKPPLVKPTNKTSSRSPRSQSQSQSQTHSQTPIERKDKHRTPSPTPKLSSSASARDRDRERDRERERIKEKERARDKERDKVRDKDKTTREKEKSREREKVRERERERERERDRDNNAKATSSRSPKRASSRQAREPLKKKEPSIEARGKVVDLQKSRSTNSSKRDTNTNASKSSPGVAASKDAAKEDRRLERGREEDKKKDDRERRDRERERDRERDRDRDVKDRSLERRKDKDKDKDKEKERKERERERERRLTREEREAAREKEREEALARCQERQRERERLKELAKKERENIPSLLHINTCAAPPGAANPAGRLRERDRDRERERERDRGLDKPPADRVERLLPLPADRIPPMRKELERQATRSQDRNRSTNRGGGAREREPERAPPFDYREGRDRDFSALGSQRVAREERRHEDSPYRRDERPPYLELEHEHYENPREREYPEERRGSGRRDRDAWDIEPVDMVIDEERRRVYGRERGERERERDRDRDREENRPPSTLKERTWDNPEYVNRAEWERNRRAAHDWPEDWDQTDHNSMEAEWRHYNRSMDSWPSDERRRWPQDFPERRSGPTSTSSHRGDADEHLDAPLVPVVEELKKDTILGKRVAEPSTEDIPEVKKPCVVPLEDSTILEDALSEISDDADEILNREDVEDNNNINHMETSINVVQQFNRNDDDFEPALEPKDAPAEEVSSGNATTTMEKEPEKESEEVKVESPVQVQVQMQMNTTSTNSNHHHHHHNHHHHHHHEQDNEEEAIDEDGIDNMDFEEISDEELEEEVKVKGLGDALGVDWASLVAECRPRAKLADKAGSAKKRWEYSSVLSRIGVSLKMAGEDIPPITIEVAAIQVAKHEATLVRSNLFASAGPYRRALSARRDLAIRRHLCNLPITDNVPTYTAPDPQFYKTVLETIAIK